MKIIRTKFMRIFSKKAMLIGPWLLLAPLANLTEEDINHERVHSRQQTELLIVFFFLWYGIEWVWRIFQYRFNFKKAYRGISFEREAYANQDNRYYLESRPVFEFFEYIKE